MENISREPIGRESEGENSASNSYNVTAKLQRVTRLTRFGNVSVLIMRIMISVAHCLRVIYFVIT